MRRVRLDFFFFSKENVCVLGARRAPQRKFLRIQMAGDGNATEGRHLGFFSILIAEMKALIEPDSLA